MWRVDSSVWIDYFNGQETPQTEQLNVALGEKPLCLGDIILCEVLQGFRDDKDYQRAKKALLKFPIYEMGGVSMALSSAKNYCLLRRRGITVRKTVDCIIATFAIQRGFWLLHNDRDFNPFEEHLGLQVVR